MRFFFVAFLLMVLFFGNGNGRLLSIDVRRISNKNGNNGSNGTIIMRNGQRFLLPWIEDRSIEIEATRLSDSLQQIHYLKMALQRAKDENDGIRKYTEKKSDFIDGLLDAFGQLKDKGVFLNVAVTAENLSAQFLPQPNVCT
eukprot:Platyproteum_vivax@DN17123_c0_g1_i1.p1